jgi:SWI/SNF-related matrix-associated actin-dependent regulator of chromatin subfamily A3
MLIIWHVCHTAPEIATKLYPHQKQALTFMLEREAELPVSGGASLWQARYNQINEKSWYHVVTQREVSEEPRSVKGAILADDVRFYLCFFICAAV